MPQASSSPSLDPPSSLIPTHSPIMHHCKSTLQSFSPLLLTLLLLFLDKVIPVTRASSSSSATGTWEAPYVPAKTLVHGILSSELSEEECSSADDNSSQSPIVPLSSTTTKKVYSCCSPTYTPHPIGSMPQFTTAQSLATLSSSEKAWNGGSGAWPTMSLLSRISNIQNFVMELNKKREEIVTVLMWEIGKNRMDAENEFDRTILFVQELIETIQNSNDLFDKSFQSIKSTRAFVRRAAIGIILCLGPFNYPLNETYATLIPALLMGNVVLMKIPTVGGLAHLLTMEAFAKTLPPGTINFISGPGRETMPPLMSKGTIDGLAFIGGSKAADDLIKSHPEPHRLKVFLQLEAKNMAIALPNIFEPEHTNALEQTLDEVVLGSLSYNGQRCTALKMIFVPKEHAESFASKLAKRVEELRVGFPWQTFDDGKYSQITPLPNDRRVKYMQQLIDDATSKGSRIVNKDGGTIVGSDKEGSESSLMIPAVLYPVTPDMDVYDEEQFGPVVPVVGYDSIETVLKYGREGKYGQQVSIFTSSVDDDGVLSSMVDKFSSVFGKININSQCGRSPDTLPFSGRRSSAMGVMSVSDALREFSVPTVVSYKVKEGDDTTEGVVEEMRKTSNFMQEI